MRTKIFFLVFLMASVTYGGEKEGFKSSKAKAAKKKYDTAVKKAKKEYEKKITTAKKTYRKDLDKSLKEAMKKGNLEEANKINEEKKELGETTKFKKIFDATILATDKKGFLIGKVKKHTIIVIQYKSGKWSDGMSQPNSPDGKCSTYQRLTLSELIRGKHTKFYNVPQNTATSPFVFKADKDYDALYLKMRDGGANGIGLDDNSGKVIYNIKIK